MSRNSRASQAAALLLGAALLFYWTAHHAEVTFAVGLRHIQSAQLIAAGDFTGGTLGAIDHPVHPLAISGVHAIFGGDSPEAWQTAAQVAAFLALTLSVIPIYLLGLELFGDELTACLGVVLIVANPILGYVAVNVLSESTFLLLWSWGLWASVRFLREGRFQWLPLAIACGGLAYLTRPEGMLLHVALVAALLLLPLHRVTRINWPRWWAATGLLILGPALLVGPYVALKGGLGTSPAVAKVLGLSAAAPASALERERALPSDQTAIETYRLAAIRMLKAVRGAVGWPLLPLVALGFVVCRPSAERSRVWLFLGLILAGSAAGLVRLHATGGYCTVRHAMIPGCLLLLVAARGLSWIMERAALDTSRLGLSWGTARPGPAVWGVLILLIVAWPLLRGSTSFASSFAPYRAAGAWIAELPAQGGRVLDLTDWSLFFSGRDGSGFDALNEAPAQLDARWLVLRQAHVDGHNRAGELARELVAGRTPVARFPEKPSANQLQILVFDLSTPSLTGRGDGKVMR